MKKSEIKKLYLTYSLEEEFNKITSNIIIKKYDKSYRNLNFKVEKILRDRIDSDYYVDKKYYQTLRILNNMYNITIKDLNDLKSYSNDNINDGINIYFYFYENVLFALYDSRNMKFYINTEMVLKNKFSIDLNTMAYLYFNMMKKYYNFKTKLSLQIISEKIIYFMRKNEKGADYTVMSNINL